MRATQNPVILIGAIILTLAGLSSIDNLISLPGILTWLSNPENTLVPATIADIFSMLVVTLGSIALAVWAFVSTNPRVLGIPAIVVMIAGSVFGFGLDVFWLLQGSSLVDAFLQTYGGVPRIAAATAVFTSFFGAGLIAVGAFSGRPGASATPAPAPAATNNFDPETGLPLK